PLGTKVSHKKLGIVGLGRIGMAIAQRAAGFDMEIRYHNRGPRNDVSYGYEASLADLAGWSDFLVVATVGGDATRRLIDAQVLKALGPNGIIINIARGSVIDEAALVQALVSGELGGAGLDVYEAEPTVPDALKTLDNVVIVPHIASATNETRKAMADLVLDNVDAFATTGKVITPVPAPYHPFQQRRHRLSRGGPSCPRYLRRKQSPLGADGCRDFLFCRLQFVVGGKITHEFPCQRLEIAQTQINYHAANAILHDGHDIRGVSQMAARGTCRTKLRHDPGKTFGPVTGTESLAVKGDAVNN